MEYIERAVQTEPPRHLSRSDDAKALNLHEPLLVADDAYNQLSSLTVAKREHKLSQLAYQKPSELNLPAKRIVSLPETSPPSRINAETVRDRVVSMSEQVKVSLTSADNSLSSECFESSIDTSQSQISSDVGNLSARRSRARRSLVYPQTPSPPSSPESVMIIGNNMQVPSSFLRQKASKLKSVNDDDDDAWITWASSPPRPIPALHGPLSLPYARCPSGAEGTIIEGEDMTRTIWGLGNDVVPPNRERSAEPRAYPQFGQPLQVHKPEFLAQPELPTRFRSLSNAPLELNEQPNIFGKPLSDDSLYISPSIDHRRLQQLSSNISRPVNSNHVWNARQLPSSKVPDTPEGYPHLKASAPEFVPSARLSHQPRVSIDPPVRSHYIIPKPQMPAIDLAYEYRTQQEGKTPQLASPCSTSSNWSPYLPTPNLPSTDTLPDVWNSEDAADELRRFIYERIGQQNLSPSDLRQISELARAMNLDRTSAYLPSSYDRPFSAPKFAPASPILNHDLYHPGPPGPPPNTPLPPLPTKRSGAMNMTPPSPNSSVTSRAGGRSGTQPRSVPFARLLQRRLSAVPEEPSLNSERLPPSPRMERLPFGGSADAQHYKPYFAQTAGKSHRSHSSNSGGEPFTAGNLEVREYVQLGPRINSTDSSSTGPHARGTRSSFRGGFTRESRERSHKPRSNVEVASNPSSVIPGNKENGLAIGRSGSADSASVAGKEVGRKKSKPKPKPKKQGR
ncbi:hypothetical protein BT96DRAFT_983028 [Gymnopus androsaceus JB14]|uniref:Uncharacterized protein n=1 Tax=Gymnopus androsaceus JB14 TaxID=1447944 RepID=A0A6A4IRC4_9AGAR|nr:hypothetical protein BT96DRAFT_983028 [Gymnopus androsaceus JB14]